MEEFVQAVVAIGAMIVIFLIWALISAAPFVLAALIIKWLFF